MIKDFDFEKIGKKTPYFTPEGFFDDMQNKILCTAEKNIRRRKRMKITVLTMLAAAAIIAGMVFIPMNTDITQIQQRQLAKGDTATGKIKGACSAEVPMCSHEQEKNIRGAETGKTLVGDKKKINSKVQSVGDVTNQEWIEQLSDEDLSSLTAMADNDEFLN
jgi:hypothetical protein